MDAEVVLVCRNLASSADFFGDAGFRLDLIFPADSPRIAALSGHGLRIRLERGEVDSGGHLRVPANRAHEMTAPNGTRLEFVTASKQQTTWQPATFILNGPNDDAWTEGRAGMLYQNLTTRRQDSNLIASRIRIARGGPVRDYVHFHRVDTQVIYCRTGEVRVVYEDQGEPFWLRPGDCVLQPPEIRHRVLECSDELEVIEVSSPAEHETGVEHDLELPTPDPRPEREFCGQRFVRHQANGAILQPWGLPGFDSRDAGMAEASGNRVAVRVVRPAEPGASGTFSHESDRRFWFVLRGAMTLTRGAETWRLQTDSACLLPPDEQFTLGDCSSDLEFLEVARNAGQDA